MLRVKPATHTLTADTDGNVVRHVGRQKLLALCRGLQCHFVCRPRKKFNRMPLIVELLYSRPYIDSCAMSVAGMLSKQFTSYRPTKESTVKAITRRGLCFHVRFLCVSLSVFSLDLLHKNAQRCLCTLYVTVFPLKRSTVNAKWSQCLHLTNIPYRIILYLIV